MSDSNSFEKDCLRYVNQQDCKTLMDGNNPIIFADLKDIKAEDLENVKTLASAVFNNLSQTGLSPIANLFLNQNFDFNQQKGEDLVSGTISTICSLSSTPVTLVLYNAAKIKDSPAFSSFLDLLKDKYLNRTDFPTFESVLISSSD